MMQALFIATLISTVAGLKIQRQDPTKVQVITFATPYRNTGNFIRFQPDSLVSSISSDFEQKGFEPLVNLGAGRTWTGNYKEKISLLRDLVAKPEYKDKIISFVDGEDVILGGCSKSEMLQKYQNIVQKSGAKIVFGAELWCFEPPTQKKEASFIALPKSMGWGQCPEPTRAEWAQKAYGDKDLDEKIRSWQDEKSAADKTTSLINLNSGFFMGPAQELLQMMEYALDEKNWFRLHNGTDYYGDQRMYGQYWFENPDKVTIDYGAELMLTAHGFKKEALEMDKSGNVQNMIFNRKQCVVHGAGYAKPMVGDLQLKRAEAIGDHKAQLTLKQRCVSMPESCGQGAALVDKIKATGLLNGIFGKR